MSERLSRFLHPPWSVETAQTPEDLGRLLAAGWEPFTATGNWIHLRKRGADRRLQALLVMGAAAFVFRWTIIALLATMAT